MKTWFITGISRGLGLALAKAALAAGDTVIGTVRSGSPDLPESGARLRVVTPAVADAVATEAAVQADFDAAGRLDVIGHNAGYSPLGDWKSVGTGRQGSGRVNHGCCRTI